jgi:hypothetical protein
MTRTALKTLLVATLVAAGAGESFAADPPKPLYARTIEKYPAPKLEDVSGREFKHLFDPAKTKPAADAGLKDLWTKVKAAAAKAGFEVTEKEKGAYKLDQSTKEYFDTPDQALWKQGYLIRLTTKYVAGVPDSSGKVTIKAIHEDPLKTLATPLKVEGVKSESECQDNVGFGPGGQLRGYVEKGSSFTVEVSALGGHTLGDFGKYMPELLKLGLPATTKLVSTKAFSYRIRPGYVVLPGTEPCGVSMEAWCAKEGDKPYLIDFSFGYDDVEFYGNDKIHAAGEAFMEKVIHGELKDLAAPNGEKWGGSKVRSLMNRPITK